MPRVAIKKKEYMKADLCKEIAGKLYQLGLKQSDLAKELGVTQPAVSAKLRTCSFTYSDLLIVFSFLKFTDDEIIKYSRLEGKNERNIRSRSHSSCY